MMTDLASLLSALTAQPGIAAQVSVGDGLASAASSSVMALHTGTAAAVIAVVTPGKLPSTPATTTATAFQAVLAAQSPVDPSVPIDPIIVGSYATASPAPNLVGQSNLPVAPAQSPASADRLTLAPVSAQQPIAKPATPGRSMPVTAAVAAAEPPAPAAPQLQLPASTREVAVDRATPVIPTKPPATISVMPDADGKLPKVGNFLPVLRIPTAPGVAAQPGVVIAAQNSSDDSQDDKPTIAAITSDPSRQPLFAPAVLVAQPVPPVMVRDATGRTTLPSAAATPMSAGPTPAATTVPAAVATAAPSPTAPGVSGARPIVPAAATSPAAPPVIPAAQTSAPATSMPPSPTTVTVPVALLAQAAPVAPAQSAPDTGTNSAAVPLPAAAVAPAAPAIANIAAVGQLPASPLPTGPSTASRLARQAGGPQSAKGDAPTDDAAAALSPALAVPPAAATPASASTASSPAATPPPDFAALVDRLLEARATAQSATPPQQISTSVTHSDFGKVSLTFRQDPAGLSVSMTSTDPGFARAAQSAMASSGQAGVGQNVTADQLSIGHAGDQNPAGNQNPTGNIGQSFSQPDAPAAVNPAATGQSASFSPAGGGSQQSQSQAQAQPQQRPGFIAANRSTAASDNGSGAAAAKGAGIFA